MPYIIFLPLHFVRGVLLNIIMVTNSYYCNVKTPSELGSSLLLYFYLFR